MKKAISAIVSFVMIVAISIVAVSVVLSIGLPAIDRAKDAALINEAKNIMQTIDSAARQVLFEGRGAQRVFSIRSTGGDYFAEKDSDSIKFKLNSISGLIDPGTKKKEGNLLIIAGTDVKAYEFNYSADPSFVGYWKLNSVNNTNYTLDFTPNHNDGRLYNYPCDPATCNFTSGKIGSALQFDGVDDYVNAGNATSLDLSSGKLTFEAWISPNTTSVQQFIIHKFVMGSGYIFEIESDKLRLVITAVVSGFYADSDVNVLSTNTWQHIAVSYNGSNAAFYVNGISKGNPALSQSIVANTVNLGIGASSGGSAPFNGTIDEVRIYNRSLSADEIRQHYYQGLKKLELGMNLVLENSHIIFEVPKIGTPSSFAAINNSQLVDKITVKENGLNITPMDSSTVIDNNLSSRNGTGYTQLMQTGELLREASIKAYIESNSGVTYEIWYTLRSNADFILQEVKNIVYR